MPASKPEEVDALFEKYLNEGNIDALVDLYEPEATLIAAPGQTASGHAAIRQALSGFIAAKANLKLNVTQTIVAGDIAVTYNDWSGTAGGAEISGRALEICRRQADGTWRFVIDDPNART
jgi:uncharacterized protein (TIGR02246 family)